MSRRHTTKTLALLLLAVIVCLVLGSDTVVITEDEEGTKVGKNEKEKESSSSSSPPAAAVAVDGDDEKIIVVQEYLEKLSDAELEAICSDRGLELAPREDGNAFQRQDYLDAARRCLSIEEEINAILAENPDLAAEIDAEVERLQATKERLEREREEMIAEKERLERQLREAGVHVDGGTMNGTDGGDNNNNTTTTTPAAAQQLSFPEVLRVSFTELFRLVESDVRFLGRVLHTVLRPLKTVMIVVWKVLRPMLSNLWKRALESIKELRIKIRPGKEAQ